MKPRSWLQDWTELGKSCHLKREIWLSIDSFWHLSPFCFFFNYGCNAACPNFDNWKGAHSTSSFPAQPQMINLSISFGWSEIRCMQMGQAGIGLVTWACTSIKVGRYWQIQLHKEAERTSARQPPSFPPGLLSRMLQTNRTIKVLDLVNCGLLPGRQSYDVVCHTGVRPCWCDFRPVLSSTNVKSMCLHMPVCL